MPCLSKLVAAAAVLAVASTSSASATIMFNENFDEGVAKWVQSTKKADYGKIAATSGDFYGDAKINQGLKTTQDARFYSVSAATPAPISNTGKKIVVSLSVKHEQGLDCGGGYIKLVPEMEQTEFDGETPYWMMFGPDRCGYTRKVHLIFNYKGKNLLWKKQPSFPDDKLTHVYTVVVNPDNTYEFYLDKELKESGSLEKDWDFLEPKEIDDASDKKPADWVDEPDMVDPEDKKPESWDDQPEKILDPEAKQPEDWDEEEDGKWEAPMIANPKYKGEWTAKRIPNPAYKGPWAPKKIANPAYTEDATLYEIKKPLNYVGIDIWQVKSGSVFDNIIIGDDLAEVNQLIDATWGATKEAEKKAGEAKEGKAASASAEAEADADEEKDE
jgi:calreticulin